MSEEKALNEPLQISALKAGLLNSSGPLPIFLVGFLVMYTAQMLPWHCNSTVISCSPWMFVRLACGLLATGLLCQGALMLSAFMLGPLPSFAKGCFLVERGHCYAELLWFNVFRFRQELKGSLRLKILPFANAGDKHFYRLVLCEDKENGLKLWLGPFEEVEAARLATVLHQKIRELTSGL